MGKGKTYAGVKDCTLYKHGSDGNFGKNRQMRRQPQNSAQAATMHVYVSIGMGLFKSA